MSFVQDYRFAIPIVVLCTGGYEWLSDEERTQLITLFAEEGMKNDSFKKYGGCGGLRMNLNAVEGEGLDVVTCYHMLVGKVDTSTLYALSRMEPPLLKPEDIVDMNLLSLACSCGHIDAVKCLLQINPNSLKVKNPNGDYPIHVTAMKGQKEVFILLLQKGIKEKFGGHEGFGGLFVKRKCHNRHLKLDLTALDCWILQSPAQWEALAPSLKEYAVGFPLIQRTISTGHSHSMRKAIKSLILHFDCAFTRDRQNKLPLHFAAEKGLRWNDGLQDILESSKYALTEIDKDTNLPPFALAAVTNDNNSKDLTSIFQLLRRNPEAIISIKNDDETTLSFPVSKRRRTTTA